MSDSRSLFLHIGSHKTGTTSIQKFLKVNGQKLKECGISVFQESVDGNFQVNLASWFDQKDISNVGAIINRDLAKKINSLPHGDVIVSSEVFSWVFDKNEIKDFISSLYGFDNLKVVVYLRRQDIQAVSHYQQAIRTKAERLFFEGDGKALPEYKGRYDNYFDYYKKILDWASVVGKDNIIVRKYDSGSLVNSDVIDDFLYVIGMKSKEAGDYFKEEKSNTSSDWYRTKVSHILIRKGIDPRSEISKKILRSLPRGGKLMPSKESAYAFYERYRDSNKRLAKFLGVNSEYFFHEDFSMWPDEDADVWDERSADEVIASFIDLINKTSK